MESDYRDGTLTIFLEGRIDSSNAPEVEKEVQFKINMLTGTDIAFDVDKLEYISSAGLRILMKVRKQQGKAIVINNVSDEIFDIFDTTGFTELFTVHRKLRTISLQGCRKISSSVNGEVFALTDDEMVKVYGKNVTLEEVYKERDLARASMVAGIPTLIPYDPVICGDRYGIVYEKAESNSFADILSKNPADSERYARQLAALLKEMNELSVDQEVFPNIKTRYSEWIREAGTLLPAAEIKELVALIRGLPDRDTWVNGNLTLSSILMQNGEILFMDMAGCAFGHPIFDLQGLFAELMANPRVDPNYSKNTYGIDSKVSYDFWQVYYDSYMTETSKEASVSMYKLLTKSFVLKQKLLAALEKKNGGSV